MLNDVVQVLVAVARDQTRVSLLGLFHDEVKLCCRVHELI